MEKFKKEKAFTLAETLIALVILGIIAAVTIPTLIRNHIDNANRAKVKKAMSMYEKALNNMIIENDLRSSNAITNFGHETLNDVECGKTRLYFKSVENSKVGNETNNCRFKTADGVWWDITNIENPIIILKDDYKAYPLDGDDDTALQKLAQGDDKFVYAMVGRYEEDKGILRINDKAYEDGLGTTSNETNIAYMEKLWNFINNQTSGGNVGGGEGEEEIPVEEGCSNDDYICKFYNNEYDTACTEEPYTTCTNYRKSNWGGYVHEVYNENDHLIFRKAGCNNKYEECTTESTFDENGTLLTTKNALYELNNIIYENDDYCGGLNNSATCRNVAQCKMENGKGICNVYDENGNRIMKINNCRDSTSVYERCFNIRIYSPEDGSANAYISDQENCNVYKGTCAKCKTSTCYYPSQ